MIDIFSYSNLIQFIILSVLAMATALLSPFLVVRKMASVTNALSHTTLLGVLVASLFFNSLNYSIAHLLFGAIFSAIVTTFLIEFLYSRVGLNQDASITLVFSFLFSLGIVITALWSRSHICTNLIVGNADLLQASDLYPLLYIFLFNAIFIAGLFPRLMWSSFDPTFFSKRMNNMLHYSMLMVVSLTIMVAFRIVGIVLALSFFIMPYLQANILSNSLKSIMKYAPMLSLLSVSFAMVINHYIFTQYSVPLSTAAMISVTMTLQYVILAGWKRYFLRTF